jgi:hypothetical protein
MEVHTIGTDQGKTVFHLVSLAPFTANLRFELIGL